MKKIITILFLLAAIAGNSQTVNSSISTGVGTKALRYNPTTRLITYTDTTTGGGSGVTTVGTFSGSAQTNGASISGSTITFGPASSTVPGMVSTGSQTWAGAKTFNGDVGIGVSPTQGKLEVTGKIWANATTPGIVQSLIQMDYPDLGIGSGVSLSFSTFGGTLVGGWENYRSGTGAYETSFKQWDGASNAEFLHVKGDGSAGSNRIGIGTSSPDSLLTVQNGFWAKRGVRLSGLASSANATDSMLVVNASNGNVGYRAMVTPTNTVTLENKRWKARVGSTTSSGTPTINTDNVDIYKLTAQAADITSFTTNLSGTPNDGDILEIQITGTAARAITWGSSFVSSTVTLPTTTVTTTTLTVVVQYFTTSSYGNNKWVCVNSF